MGHADEIALSGCGDRHHRVNLSCVVLVVASVVYVAVLGHGGVDLAVLLERQVVLLWVGPCACDTGVVLLPVARRHTHAVLSVLSLGARADTVHERLVRRALAFTIDELLATDALAHTSRDFRSTTVASANSIHE